MKLRNLGFCLIVLLTNSCTKSIKSISVTIKSVYVLYSVGDDTLRIEFPNKNKKTIIISPSLEIEKATNISLMLNFILTNNYDSKITIHLNDLKVHAISFEPILILKNETLKFYNYPFSLSRLPVENSFVLKPRESKVIYLESPIFYYSKTFSKMKLDSLIKTIKKGDLKIEMDNPINIDSRKMIILSKPNRNFPIYPKNGTGL